MWTSANNNKTVIHPQFRIETRVSIVVPEQGVEVPLGYYHGGEWVPYHFVEGDESGLELTAEDLAFWLSYSNSFGCSFLDHEEARAAIRETIQRCRELTEATGQAPPA